MLMGGMGQPMMGEQAGGGLPEGPQMSMVSQLLQQMRGGQPQQQHGSGLESLMPLIMSMMGGGGGKFSPQAMGIGQQNLGMANQSPLSLMNPNFGMGR